MTTTIKNQEAVELVERWQRQGDVRARDALVQAFMPIVHAMVQRYPGLRMHQEDARQEGAIGLMRAADKFDRCQGASFGTYATFWVRAKLTAFMQHTNLVHSGTTDRASRQLYYKLGKITRALEQRGIEATPSAIAEEFGCTLDVVHAVLNHVRGAVSIDAPMRAASGEVAWPLIELLRSVETPADDALIEASERQAARDRIEAAIIAAKLTEREQRVVRARLLVDEDDARTLGSLGDELGISRERVRQLEVRAKQQLAIALGAPLPLPAPEQQLAAVG